MAAPKNTRVLLIKYHEAADQQPLSKKAAEKLGIFPSLPLLGLASWVRQHGYDVKLIDLHAKNLLPAEAQALVREADPHIVGLTAKTLGWPAVIEIAQMVRAVCPNAIIVLGGPHLSLYPEESLTWPCFDLAVIGDGEETFLEICDRYESGSELTGIPGTVSRSKEGIVRHAPRLLARDIDQYPMSAWDLINLDDYNVLTLLKPFATMVTTRGCPWHCGYCSQVYSEKLRFRSPELVVDEMEFLQKTYGVREIVMFDETFTIGKKRMRRFSEEVQRRGLKVKFNIRARVDTVDRETLSLLKAAGLRSIHMGVEAGTDRVLKIMNKQITREQTRHAFRLAREVGIETRGYFMIGYYDATPEDIEETINFAASIGLDWASFSVATALPGTDLYTVAQERGYVQGDFWREYTVNGGGLLPQLETETFTAEQLRAYRTKAYLKFYMRPDLIRRKFSRAEGREELLEMLGGTTVLTEIVKATLLKRIPQVGLGKIATV
ncbi:MAG: B12-binding domain-containing radical SAM protein [Alphaproteobacteria bacterium]|nr:B12-binding domain-containing radical SAM protein [Alphaproteobacteria bacterium]MCB9794111.1 B12-binding domain-containing radical SAM protein [Alphaproteobacteria bacterium]